MSDIRPVTDSTKSMLSETNVIERKDDNNTSRFDEVANKILEDGSANKEEISYLLDLYYTEKASILAQTKLSIDCLNGERKKAILKPFMSGDVYIERQDDIDFVSDIVNSLKYDFPGKDKKDAFKDGKKYKLIEKKTGVYDLEEVKTDSSANVPETPKTNGTIDAKNVNDTEIADRINVILTTNKYSGNKNIDLLKKSDLKSLLNYPGETKLKEYLDKNSTALKDIAKVLFSSSSETKASSDVITELKKDYFGVTVDKIKDGARVDYWAREGVGFMLQGAGKDIGLTEKYDSANGSAFEFQPTSSLNFSSCCKNIDTFFKAQGITNNAKEHLKENDFINQDKDLNGGVSRTQLIVLLVESYVKKEEIRENNDSEKDYNFTDVQAGHKFKQYIDTARRLGITSGIGNNNFGGAEGSNREQFATILYRLKVVQDGRIPTSVDTASTVVTSTPQEVADTNNSFSNVNIDSSRVDVTSSSIVVNPNNLLKVTGTAKLTNIGIANPEEENLYLKDNNGSKIKVSKGSDGKYNFPRDNKEYTLCVKAKGNDANGKEVTKEFSYSIPKSSSENIDAYRLFDYVSIDSAGITSSANSVTVNPNNILKSSNLTNVNSLSVVEPQEYNISIKEVDSTYRNYTNKSNGVYNFYRDPLKSYEIIINAKIKDVNGNEATKEFSYRISAYETNPTPYGLSFADSSYVETGKTGVESNEAVITNVSNNTPVYVSSGQCMVWRNNTWVDLSTLGGMINSGDRIKLVGNAPSFDGGTNSVSIYINNTSTEFKIKTGISSDITPYITGGMTFPGRIIALQSDGTAKLNLSSKIRTSDIQTVQVLDANGTMISPSSTLNNSDNSVSLGQIPKGSSYQLKIQFKNGCSGMLSGVSVV